VRRRLNACRAAVADTFADHFSAAAPAYQRYRPHYPAALFDALCDGLARREVAWDCASGNGQAVAGLAARFPLVVASDASFAQLSRLPANAGVRRVVATAARTPLAAGRSTC
jgi:hypothetical protein